MKKIILGASSILIAMCAIGIFGSIQNDAYEIAYTDGDTYASDMLSIEPMEDDMQPMAMAEGGWDSPSAPPLKELGEVIMVQENEELVVWGTEYYKHIILQPGAKVYFRGECFYGDKFTYVESFGESTSIICSEGFDKEYIKVIGYNHLPGIMEMIIDFDEEHPEGYESGKTVYIDPKGNLTDEIVGPFVEPGTYYYNVYGLPPEKEEAEPIVEEPEKGDSDEPVVEEPKEEEEKEPVKEEEKKEEGGHIDVPIITPIPEEPDEPIKEEEIKDTTNYNAVIGQDFSVKKSKKGVMVTWTPIDGADGYDVYFNYCGKNKVKKVARCHGNKVLINKFHGKKIQDKNYKVQVKAYKKTDKGRVYIANTVIAHVAKNNNLNVRKVKATMPLVIKVGETASININKTKQLSDKHAKSYRFATTDPTIAKVKNGQVVGMKAGTCEIYVYAVNGVYKKFTLTVVE